MTRVFWIMTGLNLTDGIMFTWLRLYWIQVFIHYVSKDVITMREVIAGIFGLITAWIVASIIKSPSILHIWITSLFTYVSIVILVYSVDLFVLLGAIIGSYNHSINMSFISRLTACNFVDKDSRSNYDRYSHFVGCIGGIVGGMLYFTVSGIGVSVWLVWLLIYVLMDIDFLIRCILIKIGILRYDREGVE